MLDGVVVGVVAAVAGADPAGAIRLGLAMTALQLAIGALNDLRDAAADTGRKPGKPIPAGTVRPAEAWAVVGCGAAIGLGLSAVSGGGPLLLAALGLGVVLAYDLRLKGKPWSWLPFSIWLPLLPI